MKPYEWIASCPEKISRIWWVQGNPGRVKEINLGGQREHCKGNKRTHCTER